LPHITLTLIYLINASTPFECKYQIIPDIPSDFVDIGENLVMADDVATPSNPLIMLLKKEELEKTLFHVNVFQRSHK
jgi:hypothetical protein